MTFTPVKLGERDKVIQNIAENVRQGKFNQKVELHDPVLTLTEQHEVLDHFLKLHQTKRYHWRAAAVRSVMNMAARMMNPNLKVEGTDNLKALEWPAIITCNHFFSPIDNLLVRSALNQPDLSVVVELTNLKMPGMLGFFMTYADTIPVSDSVNYMGKGFIALLQSSLARKQSILIYPEREMWFNYRKPRPLERGAYYYAVRLNVPIVSCFVSMVDAPTKSDPHGINYTVHVLPPIYPDAVEKSATSQREATEKMRQIDYQQKVAAYEKAYDRQFTKDFSPDDIAGHYQ
ncbi:glycerol acyltransferase [Fructilactobacillus lindneri]|uniref:Phospholipid/glycerol acyltransferase domain-containing protein n=2 Tax=Fructilactobacillus lindneri TaxID=53444 RepID=A0A0R2JRT8_9LACO|nr:lysophospholipid acyltransferase family protein [Fructilactobacillus lindneri]ANZ59859.1 glycerol acyltransferase [Fructilactobacillus lindneri]KRN79795.1 hypothetical protein IV52_GL000200 [Fructilactobacillus lindneri DSM 20690 = JCM 11027]POG98341.1 glycerol acyltransferase [Fructilactobacillus lindneri]POH02408.1 glycerol acyltransferase [Fructilactobacillus lindneri]POH04327.1 glycerol acyltransferase [Fructilactobacillus lindneri]